MRGDGPKDSLSAAEAEELLAAWPVPDPGREFREHVWGVFVGTVGEDGLRYKISSEACEAVGFDVALSERVIPEVVRRLDTVASMKE